MTLFSFDVDSSPFPRWFGPFSPARGLYSGFRFHHKRLGTWVGDDEVRAFWPIVDSPGVRALARTVLQVWHGGRVLFLPNGLVIKPLQGDHDVGRRVLIGRFQGPIVLETPDKGVFNLNDPDHAVPGKPWAGPKSTGLECAVQPDGSLRCNWYHPTATGRETIAALLHGPDRSLASGFQKARPNEVSGRVRVTANGHVITNRKRSNGTWASLYVGRIALNRWPHQKEWIRKEH